MGCLSSSRDLPKPEIEPRTPAFQAESLPAEPQGKTQADCKFPIWSPSISYLRGLLVSVCLSVRRVSLEYQPILNGPLASLTRLRINKSRPWLRSCRGPWISGLGDGWTAVCPQELGQEVRARICDYLYSSLFILQSPLVEEFLWILISQHLFHTSLPPPYVCAEAMGAQSNSSSRKSY